MGFYYGSGAPPPEKEGTFKEVVLITWTIFRILAVPLAVIFAGVAFIVLLFFLFSMSPFFGFGLIAAGVLAIAAYGVWEAVHPPKLKE